MGNLFHPTRSRHGNLQIRVLPFCDHHLEIIKKRIEDNSSFWIISRLTFFRVCTQIFYCNIRFPNQKRFALVQHDNFSWGILLRNSSGIVVPWEILHVIKTENQLAAWLMLSTSMSMTLWCLFDISETSKLVSIIHDKIRNRLSCIILN